MSKLVIFNQQISGLVKEISHTDGRKYLIAPTVAIIEGVMNNTLYLGDEINAFIEAWDGKPLIINHPQDETGEFTSANSPELLRETLGFYFNANYVDNKLKGEWWVDIEKAEKSVLGNEVLKSLKEGKLLEQSTGLFTDIEEKVGVFNGVSYTEIARNIRPDHIAILLNEEGACSIKDGCGTPRVNANEQETDDVITLELKSFKETLKSYGQTLADSIKNLRSNNEQQNEGITVTREELINWIMENSLTLYTMAMLEVATDEELAQIAEGIAPPTETALVEQNEEVVENEGESGSQIVSPVIPIAPVTPTTPDSQLLPPEIAEFVDYLRENGGLKAIQDTIQERQVAQVAELDDLMKLVTANSIHSEEDLKDIPVNILRKMAMNIMAETGVQQTQQPVYSGRMLGVNTAQQTKSDWIVYGSEDNKEAN